MNALLRLPKPSLPWLPAGFDPDEREDALVDAVLAYYGTPGAYDANRGPLDRYVCLAAKRNLLDRAEGHVRRVARHRAVVRELGRTTRAAEEPLQETARLTDCAELDLRQHARTEEERVFLDARLLGERRTEALARLLGAGDRPIAEQRQAVKKMTDKLYARIRRCVKLARQGKVGCLAREAEVGGPDPTASHFHPDSEHRSTGRSPMDVRMVAATTPPAGAPVRSENESSSSHGPRRTSSTRRGQS